jgi:hypothetical protein
MPASPDYSPGTDTGRHRRVGRGHRVVHGDKELLEKLGRNDLCPCGSGRRFQEVLPGDRPLFDGSGRHHYF